MNDLISSSSFKRYSDMKHQVVCLDDLEEPGESGKETANLERFFKDVENVKEDMRTVEQLYNKLQESNEESKTIHNAKTIKQIRARMDSDVEQVLKRVKIITKKLEALEKSNAAQRRVPGCGPGSTVDRTRTSVVAGLGKKLKDTMDDFQQLRAKIKAEYKETVERRYFTVTGQKADEGLIEKLMSSGESENLVQKAIEEQGRVQVMDTISEIQERHDAVKEIEKNLLELHQVFLDMFELVEAQGNQLNDIESHVACASSFVIRGVHNLEVAKDMQRSLRKWTCIALVLGAIVIVVVLIPALSSVVLHR